ncbi:hypothetical protein [Xanthomonas campestris]|uniref:hypothetical protein n=1 Tax=Xanthomonas campestris TaxID=339 RepID=UPI002378CB27|nr:hypothetical protein [Xanthomonas campestris]WDK32404.1 hypothetical protein JH307_03910 [Xanthomonas campestris]
MRRRRLSVFGLALCMPYAFFIGICLWGANEAGNDYKGRFVMLQLPIGLQQSALLALGADAWLGSLSWVSAYLLFVPLTVVLLYLLGHGLQALIERPSPDF